MSTVNSLACLLFACSSLLVYDYLLTFDQEVSLVWGRRWNLGTALFIFNRYSPFAESFLSLYIRLVVISPQKCLTYTSVLTWLIVFGIIIAEIILMIRSYAIWNRDRKILYILIVNTLVCTIPGIYITNLEIQSLKFVSIKTPGKTGCTLAAASKIIVVAYLISLLSETVIVILTLIKAVSHLRRSRAPLVIKLYRDGLFFYLCCLAISLSNILLTVAGPSSVKNWLATPQHVVHSICCTRVLLFIFRSRDQRARSYSDTENPSTSSYSTPVFSSLSPMSPTTIQTEQGGEDIAMIDIVVSDSDGTAQEFVNNQHSDFRNNMDA